MVTSAGLLAACGSDSGEGGSGDVVFGFSQPYAEIPIVALVKDQVKTKAEAEGWEVRLDETQAGDLQDQIATVEAWITQGVDAISLLPADPNAFEGMAQRAANAGIVWTTYGVEMDTAAGGVLFPPELSGKVTGEATVDWINANDPDAEVLILEDPENVVTKERTEIPREMILEQTDADIVAVQPGLEQAAGLQATSDVLQAHPDISVVVCNNDDGCLGAATAFERAGRDPSKVWIIGQDGSKDALSALKEKDSFFTATAALDVAQLTDEVIGVTQRALESDWQPGDEQEYIELGPTVVSKGDDELIDRFLAAYK